MPRVPQPPRERDADRLAREAHINVLVAANRFADDMEKLCRTEGISHHQYVALWVLCLHDDTRAGIPVGAVADGLFNRASDVTRLVRRLEQAGLAATEPSPDDGRVVLVRATDDGRALFARLTPKVKAYHRRQWSALDADELSTLHELLSRALWLGPDEG